MRRLLSRFYSYGLLAITLMMSLDAVQRIERRLM